MKKSVALILLLCLLALLCGCSRIDADIPKDVSAAHDKTEAVSDTNKTYDNTIPDDIKQDYTELLGEYKKTFDEHLSDNEAQNITSDYQKLLEQYEKAVDQYKAS